MGDAGVGSGDVAALGSGIRSAKEVVLRMIRNKRKYHGSSKRLAHATSTRHMGGDFWQSYFQNRHECANIGPGFERSYSRVESGRAKQSSHAAYNKRLTKPSPSTK